MVTFTDEARHTDNIHHQNDSSMSEISEMNQEIGRTKKKKRVRRSKSCKIFSFSLVGVVVPDTF
jgi:hypothetical protein